jgi:cytochrome c peroxidase
MLAMFFLMSGGLLQGCVSDDEVDTGPESMESVADRLVKFSPLGDIPDDPTNAWADDPSAAWLGRWLFFDNRLSGSGKFSCASCHEPSLAFGDGESFSTATGTTARHAPTVLNTAYNDWMFWDGRADSHWMQALGPIEDSGEQNASRLLVVHLLDEDPDLRMAYEQVFGELADFSAMPEAGKPSDDPDDVLGQAWDSLSEDDQDLVNSTYVNVGKAIAAYERLLVRGTAPFDTYVEGVVEDDIDKQAAISAEAKAGLELFLGEGNCHFCHSGPNFSNNEFHNIGLAPAVGTNLDDIGRYGGIAKLLASEFNGVGPYSDDPESVALKLNHLVQDYEQEGQYKVPSLRNVADTAPYMHGGQFDSLTDVVNYYSELDQEPVWGHREDLMVELNWSDEQVASMVAFLESLSGETLPEVLMGPPASPIPE